MVWKTVWKFAFFIFIFSCITGNYNPNMYIPETSKVRSSMTEWTNEQRRMVLLHPAMQLFVHLKYQNLRPVTTILLIIQVSDLPIYYCAIIYKEKHPAVLANSLKISHRYIKTITADRALVSRTMFDLNFVTYALVGELFWYFLRVLHRFLIGNKVVVYKNWKN